MNNNIFTFLNMWLYFGMSTIILDIELHAFNITFFGLTIDTSGTIILELLNFRCIFDFPGFDKGIELELKPDSLWVQPMLRPFQPHSTVILFESTQELEAHITALKTLSPNKELEYIISQLEDTTTYTASLVL